MRGCWAAAAGLFSVDPKTVARLWKDVSAKIKKEFPELNADNDQQQWLLDESKGLPDTFFASGAGDRRKGKCVHEREAFKAAVKALPSNKRRKLRHLAAALEMPLIAVHKLMKEFKMTKEQPMQSGLPSLQLTSTSESCMLLTTLRTGQSIREAK